ncbi:hypothetical protein [Mycobacterium sp. shizuoka-1]|uniref:hypothetical protein n=1 Tax=Mycobacterium sp. shizuoka-1 TaxID=2039281 RepID=UPI000C07C896|nr:hypothetical protein [Mycobacterium sp. shizuoka-1]
MRGTAWGAVAGIGLTAMTACGESSYTTPTLTTTDTAGSTSSTTTAAAAPASSARSVKWVDLTAGDCLADPPPADPAVVMVDVVDCARPHRAEAYLRAPIPVNAALADVATTECATGLERYTGAPRAATYTSTYLIDSDQDRTSDNPFPSTVICLLQGADGQPLTGTARHS